MSKRNKEWAKRARAALLDLLGGKCAYCGATEQLTFDCIEHQGHDHHARSTDQRMNFYRRQHYERGNIQILCLSCNGMKGDKPATQGRFNFSQHLQHEQNPF